MKKMRVLWLMMGCLILGTGIMTGQSKYKNPGDSLECLKRLSFYREPVKAGNYMDALYSWRIAMSICPVATTQLLYSDGITITKALIGKEGSNPVRKKELVDTLMMLYDLRIDNYPAYANKALQNKMSEIRTYMPENKEYLHAAAKDWLSRVGTEAEAGVLPVYMHNVVELYEEKVLSAEDVMDAYSYVMGIIEAQEKTNNSESLQEYKQGVENLLITSGVATCENLITLFTPRFAANPTDVDLVSKIVGLLSSSGCETSDLFLQAVTALNELKPSYQTSYYLYRLHFSREETEQALGYLQAAIDSPDASDVEKGDYLIELGTILLRNNSQARAANAARQAMEKNTAVRGRAFMLLGSVWASLKCEGNEIEKLAKFWVAVDYFTKAKAADPLTAADADTFIRTYREYFPLQEDAFMYDIMDGSSYTVSCGGLRETTTVRTRK